MMRNELVADVTSSAFVNLRGEQRCASARCKATVLDGPLYEFDHGWFCVDCTVRCDRCLTVEIREHRQTNTRDNNDGDAEETASSAHHVCLVCDPCLLCDGCGCECRLSSAGLSDVPGGDWRCEACIGSPPRKRAAGECSRSPKRPRKHTQQEKSTATPQHILFGSPVTTRQEDRATPSQKPGAPPPSTAAAAAASAAATAVSPSPEKEVVRGGEAGDLQLIAKCDPKTGAIVAVFPGLAKAALSMHIPQSQIADVVEGRRRRSSCGHRCRLLSIAQYLAWMNENPEQTGHVEGLWRPQPQTNGIVYWSDKLMQQDIAERRAKQGATGRKGAISPDKSLQFSYPRVVRCSSTTCDRSNLDEDMFQFGRGDWFCKACIVDCEICSRPVVINELKDIARGSRGGHVCTTCDPCLLCDSCNRDCRLSTTGMSVVPEGHWDCEDCIDARDHPLKPCEQYSLATREAIKFWPSVTACAAETGVSAVQISQICRGKVQCGPNFSYRFCNKAETNSAGETDKKKRNGAQWRAEAATLGSINARRLRRRRTQQTPLLSGSGSGSSGGGGSASTANAVAAEAPAELCQSTPRRQRETIDQLTAERDAARDEIGRLRKRVADLERLREAVSAFVQQPAVTTAARRT